jgi:hypothetical protein
VRRAAAGLPGPAWACFRDVAGWHCTCPDRAAAAWSAAWLDAARSGVDRRAAFVVSAVDAVGADGQPVVRLTSVGCVDRDATCVPDLPGTAGSSARGGRLSARVTIDLAVAPLMRSTPAATATSIGPMTVDAAGVLTNRDPATAGLVLWSGSAAQADTAALIGQPGAPRSDRVRDGDPWLGAQTEDSLEVALLGLPATDWAGLGRVAGIDCREGFSDCADRVAAVIEAGVSAVRVRGDLAGFGGRPIGAPHRPVLLIVEGALELIGPSELHGLVWAGDLRVDGRGGPVVWRGAALSTSRLQIHGPVRIERDADALVALTREPAAVVPASGSWQEN